MKEKLNRFFWGIAYRLMNERFVVSVRFTENDVEITQNGRVISSSFPNYRPAKDELVIDWVKKEVNIRKRKF